MLKLKLLFRFPPFFLLVFSGCNGLGTEIVCEYDPPVVFSGYFNGVYDSLVGNCRWPNSSEMIGDTVRLYFYSGTFSETDRMRSGDLLRIDIWPGNDGPLIGNEDILMHLARYINGNATYTIHPSQPESFNSVVQTNVISLSRRAGGRIELENFFASTKAVPGTYAEELEIRDGIVSGVIE